MEQVYWLSTSLDGESDTRTLLYRYGRFVYSGAVLTEPVAGLEYLPGVLQGIQAVQGQIPFIGEVEELEPDSTHMTSLRALGAAVDVIHHEVTAAEPELARMVAEGAAWLEEEDAAVYFEFEAAPGFTLNVCGYTSARVLACTCAACCLHRHPCLVVLPHRRAGL